MNSKYFLTFVLILFLLSVNSVVKAEPHAFPVPYTPKKNPTHLNITFKDLPTEGSIKIFTVDGEKVIEISIPQGIGSQSWNVKNASGEDLASGVYLYQVKGSGQKTNGKLVVVR